MALGQLIHHPLAISLRARWLLGWFFCDCPGVPRVLWPWLLAFRRRKAWLPDAGALFAGA